MTKVTCDSQLVMERTPMAVSTLQVMYVATPEIAINKRLYKGNLR